MMNAYINASTSYYYSRDKSSYVGYMFTSSEQHGHATSSAIKGVVDKWYTNSGLSNFETSINENAIYCNDRNVPGADALDNNGNALGNYGTWRATGAVFGYATAYRAGLYYNSSGSMTTDATIISPTLVCINSEDKFSKGTAAGGNGYLSTPLALMTSDELMYAGAKYGSRSYSYYYYASDNSSSSTGTSYWWTMSPMYWNAAHANVVRVGGSSYAGIFSNETVWNNNASRPVVSLKSSVSVSGSGIVNDPYVVN